MAKIEFTGNLGGDAEIGFSPSGATKLVFRVADTKGKKDAQGNWDKNAEQTQWLRCTLWGPDADHYAERLKKGARVTVFGDFMARDWTDNQGATRTGLDVTVRGLSVANKRGAESAIDTGQGGAWTPPETRQQQAPANNWGPPGSDPTGPPF